MWKFFHHLWSRGKRRRSGRGRAGSRRPRLECLEGRITPVVTTRFWDGDGLDNLWSNAANWHDPAGNDGRPSPGDDLVFNNDAFVDPTSFTNTDNLGANLFFGSITFDGGKYTIDADDVSSLQLGAPGISVLGGTHVFDVNPILLSSGLPVTVGGGASLDLAGDLSGAGALTKAAPGVLILSGNNSYTGVTNVNAGFLNIRTNTALGSTSAGTTVAAGATLQMQGGIAVGAETVRLAGIGLGVGALHSVNGNNSLAGSVILDSSTQIGVTADRLTLTGVVSSGGAAGRTIVLQKIGNGTLEYAGSSANTHLGDTIVSGGTLLLNKSSGAAIRGELLVQNQGGVVRHAAANQIDDSASVTVHVDGLLDLNGFDDTIGPLHLERRGSVTTGAGTLRLNGNVSVNITTVGSTSTISGKLDLGAANRTFTVGPNNFGDSLVLSAVISGDPGVGFTKTGLGTMLLANANSYSGTGTVSQGVLAISNSTALGASGLLSGTFVAAGAALEVRGNGGPVDVAAERLSVSGSGIGNAGALRNASGTNSWGGPVELAGDATVFVAPGSQLSVSGAIIGDASEEITKIGDGTLILTASNFEFLGQMLINDGVLSARNTFALGGSPTAIGLGTTVADGAALEIEGVTVLIEPVITISGAGAGTPFTGALRLVNGTTTLLGDVVLNSLVSAIGVDAGQQLTIDGVVSGGAVPNLAKVGNGTLVLAEANTHQGGTIVSQGVLRILNAGALGTTSGGTNVNNGAALELPSTLVISQESLTLSGAGINGTGALRNLAGNSTWSGQVTIAVAGATIGVDAGNLLLSGVIVGPANGDLTKVGAGTLQMGGNASNTFQGVTRVHGGTLLLNKIGGAQAIPGALIIGDGLGGPGTDVVQLQQSNQIADNRSVTVNTSGVFDMGNRQETVSGLAMTGGRVDGPGAILTLNPSQASSNHIDTSAAAAPAVINSHLILASASPGRVVVADGLAASDLIISGDVDGFLTKLGAGTLELNSSNTTATLTLDGIGVSGGTVLVNGSLPGTGVTLSNGTLGGVGSVGDILFFNVGSPAAISPGGPDDTPGVLTAAGNVTFGPGIAFKAQLNGLTPGIQHDQLNAIGSVSLNGATLDLKIGAGFNPKLGNKFVLIANAGIDLVSGQFAQGGTITVGNVTFAIKYNEGNNDVVLEVTSVGNTPPMIRDTELTREVAEGQLATLSGRLVDPDPDDVLTLTVDWGDGTVESFAPGTEPFQVSHLYLDDDPSGTPSDEYAVTIIWSDDKGGSNRFTRTVVVNNQPPQLKAVTVSPSALAGEPVTLRGLIADDGVLDAHTLTVFWGDGSAQTFRYGEGRSSFQQQHSYRQPGTYQILLVLSDDDGGFSTQTAQVVVRSQVAPARRAP